MNPVPLDQMTLAKFAGLLSTKFRVRTDASRVVDLELVEASPGRGGANVKPAGGSPACETFSLVFRGPADPLLPQRIYRFEHGQIGEFDLFIVPVGREPDGIRYEAVFNRLAAPGTHSISS